MFVEIAMQSRYQAVKIVPCSCSRSFVNKTSIVLFQGKWLQSPTHGLLLQSLIIPLPATLEIYCCWHKNENFLEKSNIFVLFGDIVLSEECLCIVWKVWLLSPLVKFAWRNINVYWEWHSFNCRKHVRMSDGEMLRERLDNVSNLELWA